VHHVGIFSMIKLCFRTVIQQLFYLCCGNRGPCLI